MSGVVFVATTLVPYPSSCGSACAAGVTSADVARARANPFRNLGRIRRVRFISFLLRLPTARCGRHGGQLATAP
jgi:hypothetical protein